MGELFCLVFKRLRYTLALFYFNDARTRPNNKVGVFLL